MTAKLSHYREVWSRAKENYSKNQRRLINIYTRDCGICYLCGGKVPHPTDTENINSQNIPTVDHVIPRASGGRDIYENIRLAHSCCNQRKGSKSNSRHLRKTIRKKALCNIKKKYYELTYSEVLMYKFNRLKTVCWKFRNYLHFDLKLF